MAAGRNASGIQQASKRKEAARQRFQTGAELGRTVKPQGQTVKHEEKRKIGRHTSELQSHSDLVCRLLLEKKKKSVPRVELFTH